MKKISAAVLACAFAAAAWGQTDGPPRLQVQRFDVSGNTLLQPAGVDAVLEPYKGSRSLTELKHAAAALQAAYVKAGYGGVIVIVPPQEQREVGVVALTVFEGRISHIVVTGNQRDATAAVLRSVPALTPGVTPETRRIDAQVALANQNPARQLAVTLEPGAQTGEIDARVAVTEQPERRWSVSADNTGNPQTGRSRANLGLQQANLFGGDSTLNLQAQIAPQKPGAVAVLSGNLHTPLYGAGLALDVAAAWSDVDGGTTSTAAGPLQFTGKGRVLGLRLGGALPRSGDFSQRLAAGMDWRDYLNNCTITGLPAGACGSSGASVSVSPIALEYQAQWSGALPFALQLSFASNTGLFGSHRQAADVAAIRSGAPLDYKLVRLNVMGQMDLSAGWQIGWRGAGQGTGSGLVPGEQFGLGGANAVRGYAEREVTGDSALFGSAELRTPELGSAQGWLRHLKLLVFGDTGRVWNHLGSACRGSQTRCNLASAGVGARLSDGPWSVRLDLADALKTGTSTRRNDTFLHVQAAYEFQ
ncbi:MAG: ShlB/FhaC/HecB family hemolysin secretion/activation protein [Paucibacter sp.]|nr:ShlB/FhaC/HecB family hemolysin secretion/activation protein [Roseateles sp.]